ncbi:MAG: 23S rRNA (guanosine(2251)-2'-O)-methyltransferase RlmB [Alcanivoracaceae bacterium]
MNKPLMYSGYHAVEALLRHRPEAVLELFVQDARAERGDARLQGLIDQARTIGIAVQEARREVLARHAGPQHQGVVARARPRRPGDEKALEDVVIREGAALRLLVLDGVTDPHNLGACLRSADATGIHGVVVPRKNACGLTPVACRSAVGAAESVPYFEVGSLVKVLGRLTELGVLVAGTALTEDSTGLFQWHPDGAVAMVMGAEGAGMRPGVMECCQALVEIPMHGEVQSLNVSVATGVVLYHLSRSRPG